MKILISSAGRRNELLSYFSDAGANRVLVCDSDPRAASLETADVGFVAPRVDSPGYATFMTSLCEREQVDLVLSLNDLELPALADLAPALKRSGTTAVVSSRRVIDICWDKLATANFLLGNGFQSPQIHSGHACLRGDVDFPVIVKPRFGTGSISCDLAQDAEDFELVWRYQNRALRQSVIGNVSASQGLMAQERIRGVEYAIDIVNDLQGRYHGCIIKRKLSIRGDADCVVTEHDPRIEAWSRRLGETLGHVGNADLDVIVNDAGIWCVDINPRFGGAYPFSHLAQVDVPRMLLAWYSGKEALAIDYQGGIVTARTEHYLRLDRFAAESSAERKVV